MKRPTPAQLPPAPDEFVDEEAASDEADARNSEQDDITWQTAYVAYLTGGGYWTVVPSENN